MRIGLIEDCHDAKELKGKSFDLVLPFSPVAASTLRKNQKTVGNTQFFTNREHEKASEVIHNILDILQTEFHFQDSHLLVRSYLDSALFLTQQLLGHLLWMDLSLQNIVKQYPKAKFICAENNVESTSSLLQPGETFLGPLLRGHVPAHKIKIIHFKSKFSSRWKWPLLARWERALTRGQWVGINKIWVTHTQGMDKILTGKKYSLLKGINKASFCPESILDRLIEFLSSSLKKRDLPEIRLFNDGSIASSELRAFHEQLDENCDAFLNAVAQELDSLKVSWYSIFLKRWNLGIRPCLHRLIETNDDLIFLYNKHQRPVVLATYGLFGSTALGEYAGLKNSKAIMLPSCSQPPPQNKILERELYTHGVSFMGAPFPQKIVQTKFSKDYLDHYKLPGQAIITGPCLWKVSSSFQYPETPYVLLHASTHKGKEATHPYLYETPEEYIRSLKDFIEVVKKQRNWNLLIRFVPSSYLDLETLKKQLGRNPKVHIQTEGSFQLDLQMCHMVASFSSTTMEEALLMGRPVLEYGGSGRMSYLPSYQVNEGDLEVAPVYYAKTKEMLGHVLEKYPELDPYQVYQKIMGEMNLRQTSSIDSILQD